MRGNLQGKIPTPNICLSYLQIVFHSSHWRKERDYRETIRLCLR